MKTERKGKGLMSIHSCGNCTLDLSSQAKFYDYLECRQLVVWPLKGLGRLAGIVGDTVFLFMFRNFQNMSYYTVFKTICNFQSKFCPQSRGYGRIRTVKQLSASVTESVRKRELIITLVLYYFSWDIKICPYHGGVHKERFHCTIFRRQRKHF